MSGGLELAARRQPYPVAHRARAFHFPAAAAAVLFCALHIPLGVVMEQFRTLATLHALVTVAVGLWSAAAGRHPHRVALVAAYIAGAEVLWRMTKAGVIWEFGKYAVSAVLLLGMRREIRTRIPLLPLLYFAFLVPSALITLMDNGLSESRGMISFNLSGPFSLMVCASFFYHRRIPPGLLRRMVLAFVGPVLGVAGVAVFGMATAEKLTFGGDSNPLTSGGFGPNQVSAALGLGALLAFLSTLNTQETRSFRTAMLAVTLVLAAQSALTFSRGGLYAAIGAAGIGTLYTARSPQARIRLALATTLITLVGYFLLFPLLDEFTGGTLSQRFRDTTATGRDVIVRADLLIWRDNFVFGVGPGGASDLRAEWYSSRAASHTEFTRVVAEHGLVGLFSLCLLGGLGMRNLRNTHALYARAFAAALMGWSLLFMMNSGMRLVAPGFIFGLASARFLLMETEAWRQYRGSDRTNARAR